MSNLLFKIFSQRDYHDYDDNKKLSHNYIKEDERKDEE